MKINWYSNIFGTSGYAIHSRKLMNAIFQNGITDISYLGERPQDWTRNVNDAEFNIFNNNRFDDGVGFMISQPQYWRLALANGDKAFIGFLVWEGDKIPEYWLDYLEDERVTQIWVPSNFVRQAVKNTYEENDFIAWTDIVQGKIKVVPHGVDLTKFSPAKKPKKFTFVCNKGWRGGLEDRGGVPYVVKAFIEEFEGHEDVELIVKLNPAYLPPDFNFVEEMSNLGISKNSEFPKIKINNALLSEDDMSTIYNDGHVFVSACLAEGFNIPGLEAMACGLPNIQTSFGGQTEYMDDKNSLFVKEECRFTPPDISYEETQWIKPDIKDLRAKMRYAYTNPKEMKKIGLNAVKTASKYTWFNSGKKAKELLNSFNI